MPEFLVLEAGDANRSHWAGRYVIVEGKIASVRTSGTRRYLNFGENFSRDFAIVLVDKGKTTTQPKAKQTRSRFQEVGFESEMAVGKRVRVRGVLTKGTGGFILPNLPEEIEWVEDPQQARCLLNSFQS